MGTAISLWHTLPQTPHHYLQNRSQWSCEFSPNNPPSPGRVPSEAIRNYLDRWVPLFSMLCTHINNNNKIPTSCQESLIVPIYKTGFRGDPPIYHPTTLLSILGKMCTSLLLYELQDIVQQSTILGSEQTRFWYSNWYFRSLCGFHSFGL